MENGQQPANSLHPEVGVEDCETSRLGLTKREIFAAMAMQGILSRAGNWDDVKDYGFIYRESIRHADALLKALETKTE